MRALALGVALLPSLVGFSKAFGQDRSAEAASVREQIQSLQQRLMDLERGEQAKRRVTEIDPGKPRTRDQEAVGTLRAYDLNDLFAIVPQYPAKHPADIDGRDELVFPAPAAGSEGLTGMQGGMGGGGMGGGGSGFFQVGSGQATAVGGMQASMIELISVIQESTPGPWMEIDGDGGTISTIGTTLLVRATLENHQQIERLLEVLRSTWGSLKLVSLEIDWLWQTDEELRALAPNVPEAAVRVVAEDALQSIRDAQGRDQRPLGRSAQITCYNGQTVNLQSLRQVPAVTSITPIASADVVGYGPQVRALDAGTVAQFHPLVTRSGKFVVLDFHSRVNEIESGDAAPYSGANPQLDRPTVLTHRLSTALRVPVGVPTLVGGMTHTSLNQDEGYNLCVFVRAGVEDLKEAAEEETPEGDTEEMSQLDESGETPAELSHKSLLRELQQIIERQDKLRSSGANEEIQKLFDEIRAGKEERPNRSDVDDLKSEIERVSEPRIDELKREIEKLRSLERDAIQKADIESQLEQLRSERE